MKYFLSKFLLLFLILSSPFTFSQTLYLENTPPGIKAEKFNGGKLVDHPNGDIRSFNLAFSPKGDELFFSYYKATEENPEPEYEIKTYKYIDGKWEGPKTAEFSGHFWDVDINFSPDGNHIFFASDRPQQNSTNGDIYYCIRTPDGWSDPIYCGTDVNTNGGEVYPSVSKKGNIFFRSMRLGGYSGSDIYKAEWKHGNFINVRNLGPMVNSKYGQSNSVIDPDEEYILLCTSRPPDLKQQQIFVSFQISEDVWTEAEPLGSEINSEAGAGAPTISPDGKYLFFKKGKKPDRGIYWISTEYIKRMNSK